MAWEAASQIKTSARGLRSGPEDALPRTSTHISEQKELPINTTRTAPFPDRLPYHYGLTMNPPLGKVSRIKDERNEPRQCRRGDCNALIKVLINH